MLSGRFINEFERSQRAPHVLPELWNISSKKKRNEAKAEWEVMKAAWESGASSSAPCSSCGAAREGSPLGVAGPSPWSSALDRAGDVARRRSLDDILREKIGRDHVPAPAMPTVTPAGVHRQRIRDQDPHLVARPLTNADILR